MRNVTAKPIIYPIANSQYRNPTLLTATRSLPSKRPDTLESLLLLNPWKKSACKAPSARQRFRRKHVTGL
jgi:hypothetical protein